LHLLNHFTYGCSSDYPNIMNFFRIDSKGNTVIGYAAVASQWELVLRLMQHIDTRSDMLVRMSSVNPALGRQSSETNHANNSTSSSTPSVPLCAQMVQIVPLPAESSTINGDGSIQKGPRRTSVRKPTGSTRCSLLALVCKQPDGIALLRSMAALVRLFRL